METTLRTIEWEVTWSLTTDVPIRHVELTQVIESVKRGVEQAGRGEGVELDVDDLPTDDDDA